MVIISLDIFSLDFEKEMSLYNSTVVSVKWKSFNLVTQSMEIIALMISLCALAVSIYNIAKNTQLTRKSKTQDLFMDLSNNEKLIEGIDNLRKFYEKGDREFVSKEINIFLTLLIATFFCIFPPHHSPQRQIV